MGMTMAVVLSLQKCNGLEESVKAISVLNLNRVTERLTEIYSQLQLHLTGCV